MDLRPLRARVGHDDIFVREAQLVQLLLDDLAFRAPVHVVQDHGCGTIVVEGDRAQGAITASVMP